MFVVSVVVRCWGMMLCSFCFLFGPVGVCAGGFFFVFCGVFIFCVGVVVDGCGGWCVGLCGGVLGGVFMGGVEGWLEGGVLWGLVVGWYEYNS